MKKHYKYPDIERLGHDDNREILEHMDDFICVEEKVDGGNGSFWIDDETGLMYEGSRNRNLITDKDEKAFIKQRLWLRELLKDKKLNPDFIYYIEWMQTHTIKYTCIPNVIGLDVRMKHSANSEGLGMFIGREAKVHEFKKLGIKCAPLVWKGKAKELKKLDIMKIIPKSKFYDGMAEGIVIKNYVRKAPHGNHQLFAKVVREEFKECNKAVFGSVRQKNTDTQKIIEEFVTDARIRKIVLKFVNEEGMKLEMKLMHKVPTATIKDILKEEFGTIFEKYKFIDFKEMKQKVSKKCLMMINQMMLEKAK